MSKLTGAVEHGSKLIAPFKILAIPLGKRHVVYHATTPSQSPLHSRHQQAPSSSLAVTAQKTLASLVKTWNSWNHAKEGSLKKRTYTFGQKLLDRVPIEETFLVHIPSLRGHHPESLGKVSMRKHCL